MSRAEKNMSFGIKSGFLNTNLSSVSYTMCTKSLFSEACFYLLVKLKSTFDTKAIKEDIINPSSILVI